MLSKQGDSLQYLLDVRDGKIKQGLGLDCFLDEHLRFKPKQLNIILGHDNVGKTYWINWLCDLKRFIRIIALSKSLLLL